MQKYKKKSYCKFVLHLPYLHLIPSLVPPYRRCLFVFYSSFVRLLFVLCSFFVRSLFVLCSFFVCLLFVHCLSFVRSLFVSLFRYYTPSPWERDGERIFSSSFLYLLVWLAPARVARTICLSCYDCLCGSHIC